jgi:hypothetical protein
MALDDDVVALLGTIAELPTQQLMAGRAALQDERDTRA